MRMASLSENNLWFAFSETGQLSVTSTADLHSPSSAVYDVLNVMHVRMASLFEDNLWSETGLSFPQLIYIYIREKAFREMKKRCRDDHCSKK